MDKKNNGGPAFPSSNDVSFGGFSTGGHAGMSLRDHFAGIALQGELSSQHPDFDKQNYTDTPDDMDGLAGWCYRMADAMLAARSK